MAAKPFEDDADPFADLIPQRAVARADDDEDEGNPFLDLVPKEKPDSFLSAARERGEAFNSDLAQGAMRFAKLVPDFLSIGETTPFASKGSDFMQRGIDSAQSMKSPGVLAEESKPIWTRDPVAPPDELGGGPPESQAWYEGYRFHTPNMAQVNSTAGQMIPQIPGLLGVAGGASRAAQALGVSEKVAKTAGLGVGNMTTVAPAQYADVYREAFKETMGNLAAEAEWKKQPFDKVAAEQKAHDIARAQALKTTAVVAPLTAATGALGLGLAARAEGGNVVARVAKGVAVDAPFEGIEEGGQSLAGDYGRGRPYDVPAALSGTTMGALVGGAAGGAVALAQRPTPRIQTGDTAVDQGANAAASAIDAAKLTSAPREARRVADIPQTLAPAPLPPLASNVSEATARPTQPQGGELYASGKRVRYRGNVEQMRAKLAAAGVQNQGFYWNEDGQPAGLYFPASRKAELDSLLVEPSPVAASVTPTEATTESLTTPEVAPRAVAANPSKSLGTTLDPRRRTLDEFEARLSAFASSRSLDDASVAELRKRFAPPEDLDPVTGLHQKATFQPTLKAAQDIARSGKPVQYVEADLTNLGGLNERFGTAKADPHLRSIAEILKAEAEGAGAEEAVVIRKGGDEFGIVLVGATTEQAEQAMDRARARASEYATANGLADIPHTKGGQPGVGLHYGIATIEPDANLEDVRSVADSVVERRKKGLGYGQYIETGAVGPERRSAGPAVEGAGREAAGSRGANQGRAPVAAAASAAAATVPAETVGAYEPAVRQERQTDSAGSNTAETAERTARRTGDVGGRLGEDAQEPGPNRSEPAASTQEVADVREDATRYSDTRPLPASAGGADRIEQPRRVRNVDAAGRVPDRIDVLTREGGEAPQAPRLAQLAKQVEVGTFHTGVTKVESWQDAAHIVAPIRKSAQEVMAALVLDKDGKPLSVIRAHRGTIDGASVDPWSLVGAVMEIPGARSVFFAHNHPSGVTTQSGADEAVTDKLTHMLRDTGVESRGMIVVGPGTRNATFYGTERRQIHSVVTAKARTAGEVPITERQLRRIGSLDAGLQIGSPTEAREYIASLPEDSGVLLLNTRNIPVGVVPMTTDEMSKLKTGDPATGIGRLISIAQKANAPAAMVFGPEAPAVNVGRALNRMELRVLDVFADGKSLAQAGRDTWKADFYTSKRESPAKRAGDPKQRVAAVRDQLVSAFGNRFRMRALESGLVNVVTSQDVEQIVPRAERTAAQNGEIKGLYSGGKVYLVADTLEDADVIPVTMHELGVHALHLAKNDGEWQGALNVVRKNRNRNPDVTAAYAKAEAANTPAEHLDEEALAYLIEAKPGYTAAERIINAIKRLLNRLGIALSVIDADLEALQNAAAKAVRDFASGKLTIREPSEAKYSRPVARDGSLSLDADGAPPITTNVATAPPEAPDNQPPEGAPPAPAIESHLENFARLRIFFDSAADVLRRQPEFRDLADALEAYYDGRRERIGRVNGVLRPVTKAASKDDLAAFRRYQEHLQNGRGSQAARELADGSNNLRAMVEAWRDVAEFSGRENQEIGVKVFDEQAGKWRPIGRVPDFFPRVLKPEFQNAIRNPHKHPKDWNKLVAILLAEGRIEKAEDASRFIATYFDTETSADYFAGIEKARKEPLPEDVYDYSWDAALSYGQRWADRISQIEAFGQKTGAGAKDLFDITIGRTVDERTRVYISQISDSVYRVRSKAPAAQAAAYLNTFATGAHLGNPNSSMLNAIGGAWLNTSTFGVTKSLRGFADLLITRRTVTDAIERGIITDDYYQIATDADQADVSHYVRDLTSGLLKVSGYNSAETFARTHAMLTGKFFLRSALKHWNSNIESGRSKRALAWFQRNGFDYRPLVLENGKGPETDRFLRYASNIAQGSYDLAQTPVWVDHALGRFFFKYNKFGTQLSRAFWKNHLEPFVKSAFQGGEEITYENKRGEIVKERVRTFVPLLRFFATAVPFGWFVNYLRATIFGYFAGGPDDDELKKEWDDAGEDKWTLLLDDDKRSQMFALLFERAWHSMMAIGAMGFFGSYAQLGEDIADRQRFKVPWSPPAVAPPAEMGKLALKGIDQGTLTLDDFDDTAKRIFSIYRTGKRLAARGMRLFTTESDFANLEAAQMEKAYARKMARRYADEVGLEAKRRAPESIGATEMTPISRKVTDALLLGNAEQAKQIVADYLKTTRTEHEAATALQSIRESVKRQQPVVVSVAPSAWQRKQFFAWAREHMTKEGFARISTIDQRYRDAAARSKVWDPRDGEELYEGPGFIDDRVIQKSIDELDEKKQQWTDAQRDRWLRRKGWLESSVRPHDAGTVHGHPGENIGPSTEDDAAIMGTVKGARNAPKIEVVGNWSKLPEEVRAVFDNGGDGAFDMRSKTVYVLDNLPPAYAEWVAYHEIAGHYGLQGSMGERIEPILNQAMQNETVNALAEKMQASSGYKDAYKLDAVEEALAELAAATRTNNYRPIENEWGVEVPASLRVGLEGDMRRVVMRVKRTLAILTGRPREKFSDAQALDLVEGAWRYVKDES